MKAIFLDRDGVVNKYPGDTKYVTSWREFKFLPRVKKAIALLNQKKYPIFIISNQAGVSKGIYSRNALDLITKNMLKDLIKAGAKINGVYYCTHRDEDNCSCRKPRSGLVRAAIKNRNIDLENSFFIGDTIRDVQTAKSAGCKSILVFSGKEKLSNRKNWPAHPDYVFEDLLEAARFVLSSEITR